MNLFSQKQVKSVIGQMFKGSILEPFLWIKIVNAYFKELGNFHSFQQCDIILYIKVLNIGQLFRIIMLIWSCRQGDPLNLVNNTSNSFVRWWLYIKHIQGFIQFSHPSFEFKLQVFVKNE